MLASLTAALSFETWVAWHDFPPFAYLAIVGVVAAVTAGRFFPTRGPGLIAASGYATPVLFVLTVGYALSFRALWPLVLLGAMAPTMSRRWSVPAPLLYPLVAWSVGIALTWPMIALREYDWMPWLMLHRPAEPSNAIHGLPAAVRIAQAAELDLLGIVWLDWLYGRFQRSSSDIFEQAIALPMLIGAVVASGVTLYQGFVDASFGVQGDFWPILERAAGPLLDANASGALSALCAALLVPLAFTVAGWRTRGLLACAAVAMLAAVWVTGSRTALLIAVVALISLVPLAVARRALWRPLIGALAASLVIVAVLRMAGVSGMAGPFVRNQALFDTFSKEGIGATIEQLWERQGYGRAAIDVIRLFPWQGVGIGAFGGIANEYKRIPPDNAQNWFRHELAELGVVGSLGWAAWAALVLYAMWRPAAEAERWKAIPVKYTIAGFTLASMLGVPGQNLFVAMSLWTLLFWLVRATWPGTDRPVSSRLLAGAVGISVVFAGLTLYAGFSGLRQPFRAQRFEYPYRYGLRSTLGPRGETRTSDHAVVVQMAEGKRLRLEMWVEHPDADVNPVVVKVWLDGREIVAGRFGHLTPLIRVEPVNPGRYIVLETRVDRTFPTGDPTNPQGGLSFRLDYLP